MIVTDVVGKRKSGKEQKGFYLDRWLKENLDGIPSFIAKDWDLVGVVSGSGLVRSGKSTLAIQIGQYIAWRIAGGEVISDENGKAIQIIPPTKEVRFNLDHVVFSPQELMEKARKFPMNSVFVYDEGRAGLDSKRAMESVNKGMEDFFQECGMYNHVILIVLPDFFKLHFDYAITRSMFLINVGVDKKWNRGIFNFYNRNQKEWLFTLGKRKIGSFGKYNAVKSSFFGSFSSWSPFNKKEYEKKKKEALEKKEITRFQKRFKLQRDCMMYLYNKVTGKHNKQIAEDLAETCEYDIGEDLVKEGIQEIRRRRGELDKK